ncbi:MAG TPA: hypothetical protein ENK28_01590 [Aliiroseovarius sp.]|nr:hypothetical protein [Aliiroseovarius sp.]
MPSQAKSAKGDICVFGDSHIGSVKRALDRGLIDTGGRQITFWGADGPSFRALRWKNGRIVPDPEARDIVAQVNGGSHDTIGPDDFDLFIFYGARLRVQEYFASILPDLRRPELGLSSAAMQAITDRWTVRTRAWRFARNFARAGAQIVFVPTSFPTKGILKPAVERKRYHVASTKAERAQLWRVLENAAQRRGFTLVPQPDDTVTKTTMTRSEFAAEGAQESGDMVHKSDEYAALMIKAALQSARESRASKAA